MKHWKYRAMPAGNTSRAKDLGVVREAIPSRLSLICFCALFLAASANAQDGRVVLSIDSYRTDLVRDETRHEILPVAVFEDGQFQKASQWSRPPAERTMRRDLLVAHPAVQVLHRGLRIGTLVVSRIDRQVFHCTGHFVGVGDFRQDAAQPVSEVTDSSWAWLAGETIEYRSQSFLALSGAIDPIPASGNPLVVAVTDPQEIAQFAMDVASVAPRQDLAPLSEDETKVYRLDSYGAVLVVRKRRSAEMLPFPVEGVELVSPLMTDIVVVRTGGSEERIVQPVWVSGTGMDSWGIGPQDFFIDAFEIGGGAAYLAFHRRNREANLLRLYRLTASGRPDLVFEDDLFGC